MYNTCSIYVVCIDTIVFIVFYSIYMVYNILSMRNLLDVTINRMFFFNDCLQLGWDFATGRNDVPPK